MLSDAGPEEVIDPQLELAHKVRIIIYIPTVPFGVSALLCLVSSSAIPYHSKSPWGSEIVYAAN